MRSPRLLLIAALAAAALLLPAAAQAQTPSCPCSVFSATDAPTGDALQDSPIEVGMKIKPTQDGEITALRFYKQANNTGTHVGHLWSSTGQLLATAEFDGETASGWQEERLANPVPVTANTTYIVSYFSSLGRFGFSPGYFSQQIGQSPLVAPADAAAGGNGVYRYGSASAFPDTSWNATNYWVDAVFEVPGAADTRAPRVSTVTPADGATGVPVSTTVTAAFDETMTASSITSSTFTLKNAQGTVQPATVSYDAASQTATLTPTSPLTFGAQYTATVKGGTGGVADAAGNVLAADRSWSFTGPPACPCTVFGADAPLGDAQIDNPLEVGMRFKSTDDGFITHLRFYKQLGNTGTHVGHLWTSTGQLLATATFDDETTSGWQDVELGNPVAITKDTVYVVSYYAANGRYAFSPGFFSNALNRPPLTAPSGLDGGNGVFKYGPSAFPDQTFNGTNYWVDATFERTRPPDTRPPHVLTRTPADGSTGSSPTAPVTATFDEALDPLTVNSGAVTLVDSDSNPVLATVSYDSAARKVTLQPTAALPVGKTFTARLKSGNAGVTDLAGNKLTADQTWSFTTPPPCPCRVFGAADAPSSATAVRDNPLEVGMRFRTTEDGYITSLRFYKQANNTGTHTGHLWSSTGQLLATATFTNESASGWQDVNLPNPVAVTKDTTYVVSYYAASGWFAFDPGGFNAAKGAPPMSAPASTPTDGNGVYKYGASAFPDQTFNATNYWVDATFERTIPPDTRGPIVIETDPAASAIDVDRSAVIKATFDEALDPASVTPTAFTLRNDAGTAVPATTTYDAQTKTAQLHPTGELAYSTEYTATLKSGTGGVTDAAGNPLAAQKTWTFTSAGQSPSDGPGGPILVVTNGSDKFSDYYAEMLRGEGLNSFEMNDGPVTAAKLTGKTTVILATASVTDAEVATLTSWVQGGGNLIAMKPDKKLAPLLGLTDAGSTLSEGYMKVDTTSAAGAGIEPLSMQYHGTADRYTLNGASAIATLYSNQTTATTNPAVSLRGVGTGGGQAAAFTYDLARSIVYTRQGNPAWAGQKRDGLNNSIRSDDLFYGAKVGDVQPDWVASNRFAVPQADEQQRLLANLITQMNLDKAPLPRFWYLPRGDKAALVLTGDDHAQGGTPAYFDRLKTFDKPGCSVADWQCVRATSYMYPDTPISDAQAAGYQADGFELGLHLLTNCQDFTPTTLNGFLTTQLAAFNNSWPSLRPPATNRTHCTTWSDWATEPKLERQQGIRFDTNYYYIGPQDWMLANGPGLMTGSGFPQRFADTDGSLIDVYQAMTQVSDEAEDFMPTTAQMHTLFNNALGSKAYYGAFTAILHTDLGDHTQVNDMVSEAIDRGIPVVTSAQMLDWLDGRNGSSFANIAYNANHLTFTVNTNDKARGIEAMIPFQGAGGPLSRLTRGGQPVSWTHRTVKGVDYAVYKAVAGDYDATYSTDTRAPDIVQVAATPDSEDHATITWNTDEPSTTRVEYGRTSTLGSEVSATAPVSAHSIELSGLTPGTTYSYRVSSTDAAGNTGQSAILTFTTGPGTLVDSRTSDFAAGTLSSAYAGGSLDGADGELQLQPTIGQEFEGSSGPAGWTVSPWTIGGSVITGLGALSADGAVTYPTTFYSSPRTLEFSATFRPVNNQGVGFSNDFSDYPFAAFSSGDGGQPFGVYATSGADPTTGRSELLPGVALNVPHRFKIVWKPTSVEFYVDGVAKATHPVSIAADMRPVVSDYGLFGASTKVDWLRMGSYSTLGTLTSRVLDSGPGSAVWGTLSAQQTLPTGTGITFQTRSGATKTPDASWSAWQSLNASSGIVSPAARYIQYKAQLTGDGLSTPTLQRVSVGYSAGTNRAPNTGTVTLSPASPRTNQVVTASVSAFSDPDGDAISYRYRWLRNGNEIAGAAGSTLDLNATGNGDRGDSIRVEVYAIDNRGAASDTVANTTTVANTAPTVGTATIAPSPTSSNDVVRAVPASFSDIDGDSLTYRYQWLRNGTAISGATNRTLDLSVAGNGDFGDTIAVDVSAIDGNGGTSSTVRATRQITSTNSAPVAGTLAVAPSPARTAQIVTATPSGFVERDNQTITYQYQWFKNGTAIGGATASTLNLATAGNGDRGDVIRVDVTGRDPAGATSETVSATTNIVNTAPVAGTVSVKPTAPSSDDTVSATTTGFSDADGDALTYTYQWFKNGTAITGATGRSLDLSHAGNGDAGDVIAVDVTALDGSGGTSATVRGSDTVSSSGTSPVASFGFEEAAGTTAVNQTGATDGTLDNGAARDNSGRFGRALSLDGSDDVVTVPTDESLALTTGMTLEAWVKPDKTTDWRTVVFKESNAGIAYGLYANSVDDHASVHTGVDGDTGIEGTAAIDPNQWTHLAATYDGNILRLYVNGVQVSSLNDPGELPTDIGPLTIGGNSVWGEHFSGLIDEVRVYNRRLTTEQIKADMDKPVVSGTPKPPVDNSPDAVGQFATPQDWPITPVHLALTSDGRIAAWDGFEAAVNSEHTWDPWSGQFDAIPTGRNLFCAGHIQLQDGRLLVAGGHEAAYEGTKDTNLFNPQTDTWTRGADMFNARWYPTVTGLPDGRVFVVSGDNANFNNQFNTNVEVPLRIASDTTPEIYNPNTDTWTQLPSASRTMPLYPFIFSLPDGRLFDAGPERMTRTLNLNTGTWTNVGMSPIDGMSAVQYRPGKILKAGTWSDPEFPDRDTTNRAATIDMNQSSPAWQEAAPMKYRRSFNTLTVLPDGKVLSTGGQTGTDGVDEKTGVLPAEMWDPDTNTWKTMASSHRPRLYHSSAILLPDARVLLAGGGAFGNAKNEKSGELYSPPYLFKGARPTVTAAPKALHYGQSFQVDTPNAASISKVSLVRMGSVTHNIDMDQRYMELSKSVNSDGLTISGPPNANTAPPGMYMVFLVNSNGVPSQGQIVRVDSAVDTTAPSAPGALSAAVAGTARANLSWGAASDNVGVDEYRVFRSTTSGFTPSAANRIARVSSGTTYADKGLATGTYYYRVRAVDKAGNLGPASNQAQAAIAGDTTAPTVSLTAPANNASVSNTVNVTANAADAVGVDSVQFKLDGQDLGAADTAAPYATSWDTTKATDGPHTLTAVARDASGNSTTATNVSVGVHNTGLVAAYGFDETSGLNATDAVNNNTGTISGATRTTDGRFGSSLSFDGVDDWVSVPSSTALNLSAGMTLEAWVKPSVLGNWRSVIMKEQASALPYALYANSDTGTPAASVFTTAAFTASGLPTLGLGSWTHLAMSWDGSVVRLYVDGALVATQAAPGALLTSTGQLRIGGNSLRGEFFTGQIDEVRVYDRALAANRIAADMNSPVDP